MATNTTTIKFVGQFDSSGIVQGLQNIRKQMSSSHIGEELRKQIEGQLGKVEANIPALEKFANKGEYNAKDFQEFQKVVQQVSKDMLALDELVAKTDFSKVFSEADTAKIKQFENQLAEVENKLKTTRQEIINTFSSKKEGQIGGKSNATLNGIIDQILSVPPDQMQDKLNEIISEASKQMENAQEQLVNVFSHSNKAKTVENMTDILWGKGSGVTVKHGEAERLKATFNEIRAAILEFNETTSSTEVETQIKKLIELINDPAFENTKDKESAFKNLFPPDVLNKLKEYAGNFDEFKKLLGPDGLKLLADGEAEKAEITAQQTEFLRKAVQELGEAGLLTKEQIDAINKALGIINGKIEEGKNKVKDQDDQLKTLNATFGTLAHRIEYAVSAMAIFNKTTQIIRNAINSVKELDAAFTQIAIVSEQSNESAWKMFDSFNSLAKQYSITTKDLTEGAKLFYQQGLNAADTMKMVEASTISAALGEVSMTEAANTLTAAIQGYNESAAVAMDYTDKIAMVGAVSAADFNELSAAMEKTASSAYTAGIDFDHLLGYLGKMIEVTREAPANLGTAMKTIIARFEDMKKDPDALIDGASANKVEAALATIGIALRDTAGEFRPLQDVFDELGMKWETLTRNQQAYIATVAAGSRQQSRFLAMMNNYNRTLDLIAESQNSAGAAAEQYAIYQDSVAAAQARLTASWENFYSKIVDNDIIKFAINGLSNLIDALSHVPPAITAIGTAFGALSIQHVLQSNGGLIHIIQKMLGDNAEKSVASAGIGLAKKFIDNFKNKSINEIADNSSIWKSLTNSVDGAGKSLSKIPKILGDIGSGFVTTGKVILGFISGNWQILAVLALVTAAVVLITRKLNENKRAYEENIESIKKLQDEANELNNKANNAEELLNIYNELTSKVNRTAEEQEKLNSTIKSISEVYPEAITYIDEYGNSHLENAKILKEEIDLEKELAKEKNRSALQQREELLSGKREEWKKEDFTDIGFSNAQVEAYFKYQDDVEYYKKLSENSIVNGGKRGSFKHKGTSQLEEDLQYSLELEEDNIVRINKINDFIDKYELKISKLSDKAKWEDVERTLNKIKELHSNLDSYMDDALAKQDEIVEKLIQDNTIQLSFLDLVFSEKTGTGTSQKAIAAQLKTYLSSLGTESFNAFKDSFGKKSLTEIIQDAIDRIDNTDEAIDAKNLIEKVLDPNNYDKDLSEDFVELGELCGSDFAEGLARSREEQKKVIRENTIEALQSMFGQDINTDIIPEDLTSADANAFTTAGTLINNNISGGNGIYKMGKVEQIAPFIKDIQQLQEDTIKNGTYANYDKLWNDILESAKQNFSEYGELYEIIVEFAKKSSDEVKEAAENQIFDALQTDLQKFVAEGKDTLKNIYSGEGTKLTDTKYTSSDIGTYWDQESGEVMVSALSLALDLEEQRAGYAERIKSAYENNSIELNNEVKKYNELNDKIEKLKENGEKISDEDLKNLQTAEKRINQLKVQNSLLAQQYKYLKDQNEDTAQVGWGISLKLAEDYQKQLKTINSIEEALSKKSFLNIDEMNQIYEVMPRFATMFTEIENDMYTVKADSINNMKELIKEEYEFQLNIQRQIAVMEYKAAKAEYDELVKQAKAKGDVNIAGTEQEIALMDKEVLANESKDKAVVEAAKEAADKSGQVGSKAANNLVTMIREALVQIGKDFKDFMEDGELNVTTLFNAIGSKFNRNEFTAVFNAEFNEESFKNEINKLGDNELLEAAINNAYSRMNAALAKIRSLNEINVPGIEKLEKSLKDAGKSGSDSFDKLSKEIEKLADALNDLDDLLVDFKRDLDDIEVDYSPFTELFEAWEHEWDYYYNIKNLISQLGKQGEYIDNIISSEYTSATEKLEAYDAKIGNITAKMAANDAYMTTLRAGIAQQAVKFEKEFNRYYNVDNVMGNWQIFQKDTTLTEWNQVHDSIAKASYELSKFINQQENELNLLEATQDALEQERSTYESILNTVDSVIDSLKDNEDITVDLSELQGIKAELELSIKNESVEDIKNQVRALNDYINELNWQLDLNDNVVLNGIDKAFDRMEDGIDHIQELMDALNDTISEQQQLLQEVSEIYNYYVETAISTEQELYNAIVENYQNEINEKKKQYDYLKQLDNDYLNSIKKNISDERKAREDANKQKSYQQNLQRAQLLQMDTSGAYRGELANLNKEIENQRQDLYDDLVDKQVEALQKEIEKRHELYDMEVKALEERLAFYQENAIILWEMVNQIVADGSEAMMATLENTIDYVNSNELAKERQRKQWELSIQTTFKGVIDGEIESLKTRIEKGNEYIKSLEEIKAAVDKNTETYQQSTALLIDENANFQSTMDAYMQVWTDMTNGLTGYYADWQITVSKVKEAMETDIDELIALGDDGGPIDQLRETLEKSARDMYNSFIEERNSYKDQLEGIVNDIRVRISAAITNAANAIQNAANNIRINPNSSNTSGGDSNYTPTTSQTSAASNYTPTTSQTPVTSDSSTNSVINHNKEFYREEYVPINESYHNHIIFYFVGPTETKKELHEWEYISSRKRRCKKCGYEKQTSPEAGTNASSEVMMKYASGGVANYSGLAWLDGSKSNPEAVLNPKQTRLFETMVSSLERTANNSNVNSPLGSSYNIGDINTSIQVAKLDDQTDIDKLARKVEDKIVKTIRNRVVVSV